MTSKTNSDTKQGMVQDMRNIRDQINMEIQDMTFEEQRAYLDQLLAENPEDNAHHSITKNEH